MMNLLDKRLGPTANIVKAAPPESGPPEEGGGLAENPEDASPDETLLSAQNEEEDRLARLRESQKSRPSQKSQGGSRIRAAGQDILKTAGFLSALNDAKSSLRPTTMLSGDEHGGMSDGPLSPVRKGSTFGNKASVSGTKSNHTGLLASDAMNESSKDLLHGFYKFPYKEIEPSPAFLSFDFVPGSKPMQAKPFVFISSAHLQSEHFDVVKVFQALSAPVDNKLKDITPQVKVPSIIFRLNSANDSNTWNVRLPHSRMNLAACQFNIEKPNDDLFINNVGVQDAIEDGEDGNEDQAAGGESQDPTGAEVDAHGAGPTTKLLTRRGSLMDPFKSHLHLESFRTSEPPKKVPAQPSQPTVPVRRPKKEADLDEEILKRRRALNHGKPAKESQPAKEPQSANVKRLQASRSSLGHYCSVLREKCKRLLKGTYAACEQAGAMFRIDDNWSEDCPNDYVTEWLTDGYRDENIKLIGVGDIKNFHPMLQGAFSGQGVYYDKAKPFKHDDDEDYHPSEFLIPPDVIEGFTRVAAIDAKIAELKELRAWRTALSVAALQDAFASPVEGKSLSSMNQHEMDSCWKSASSEKKATLTQKALDDAMFHVRSCQKQMADEILQYSCFLFDKSPLPGMEARVADLLVTEQEEVREPSDISGELNNLLARCATFLPKYADKNTPEDMKTLKDEPSKSHKGREDLGSAHMDEGKSLFAILDELFNVDGMDPSLEAVDYIVTQYMKIRAFFAMPRGSDGRRKLSFPHRALTHLILTDDIDLFELKFTEIVPWGAIIINGGEPTADVAVDCVQRGRPLISVKYTGGTADLVVGMLEKKNFYLKAKKIDPEFDMPVPNEVAYYVKMPDEGWQQDDWLKAFDRPHTRSAFKMNALLENWPDRFSEASVFVVDTFLTTEDDVQDRITQTMGVVFESAHELGGSVSEQKRLTYAWRVRHKFLFNANLYKFISDLLYLLITMLTMFCTMSAVIYSYVQIYPAQLSPNMIADSELYLSALNLVLPLVTTIVRGIYASVSPLLKYVALKNACVQVEGEIYSYRTKVGKYSVTKKSPSADDKKKKDKGGKDDKGKEKKVAAKGGGNGGNPRKAFSSALDAIWSDLSSSDVQNGSLRNPFTIFIGFDETPLTDINKRIMSNREEQENYLTLLMAKMEKEDDKKKKKKKKDAVVPSDEERLLEEKLERFKKRSIKRNHDKGRTDKAVDDEHEVEAGGADQEEKEEEEKGCFEQVFKIKFLALFLPEFVFMNETETRPLGNHIVVEKKDENGNLVVITTKEKEKIDRKAAEKKFKKDRPLGYLIYKNTYVRLENYLSFVLEQYEQARYAAEEAQKRIAQMANGKKIVLDDGMTALSADQYVRIRLLPMAASYSAQAPGLASSVSVSAVISVILSVASSALSTFQLSVFIPALLAISGAVTAWNSYQQIELRLMQTNAAVNQLNQLLVWWDGLTMIEKRVPMHKETLVRVTEECIQAQATIFSGGSRKNDSNDGADEDDGEKKDGGK